MYNRIYRITAFALILVLPTVAAHAQVWVHGPVEGPNGNFYEFVAQRSVDWDTAKIAAEAKSHLGASGHLATITSMEEDDFIEQERQDHTSLFEVWVGGSQVPITEAVPTAGWTWVNSEGTFPGTNVGPEYTNWPEAPDPIEPNDAHGVASEQHLAVGLNDSQLWNDEGGPGIGNITGYVIEYDVASRFVPPGPGGVISDGESTGVSGAYTNVLVGGNASINCCTVVDWREGAGSGRRFGNFLAVDFDIGAEIDTTVGCEALRVYGGTFGSGKARWHPWQRAVPADTEADDRTGTEVGVCLVRSDAIARGVLFTAEETDTVLGYTVDCTEPQIDDRPYTSGVALVPTDVDSPYAVRESADCNRSRSGKRSSDRLVVLNEWHYVEHTNTKPYLAGFYDSLLQIIDDERTRIAACVDNTGGYLDDLTSFVEAAKKYTGKKKSGPHKAVDNLDNATRLALLIDTVPASGPVVPSDPYISSTSCDANNAQGLIAGRLMALKFAVCSELRHKKTSSSSADGACVIEPDIFAELPPLP